MPQPIGCPHFVGRRCGACRRAARAARDARQCAKARAKRAARRAAVAAVETSWIELRLARLELERRRVRWCPPHFSTVWIRPVRESQNL